jgi:hypothetical protein
LGWLVRRRWPVLLRALRMMPLRVRLARPLVDFVLLRLDQPFSNSPIDS